MKPVITIDSILNLILILEGLKALADKPFEDYPEDLQKMLYNAKYLQYQKDTLIQQIEEILTISHLI